MSRDVPESPFPHRHLWRVIDRTVLDSALDKMIANGLTKFDARSTADSELLTHRPVIVTSRCSKCGTEKVERV